MRKKNCYNNIQKKFKILVKNKIEKDLILILLLILKLKVKKTKFKLYNLIMIKTNINLENFIFNNIVNNKNIF